MDVLPPEVMERLAPHLRRESIAAGEDVVRQGEPGERFYVVLEGELGVVQESWGPRRRLGPGEFFGEVALALSIPRTATVRALVPSVVGSCNRAAFDELVRPLFADDSSG